MIWYYIVKFFGNFLDWIFSWLPKITKLPNISGFDIDYYFSLGIGYFRSLMLLFPPFNVVLNAFMFYMAFRVTLLTLRLLRVIR